MVSHHYYFICIFSFVQEDPVVDPSGDSYERSAVMEREGDSELLTFYPNRALRAFIERELERFQDLDEGGSMRGTLRRLDENLRQGWDKVVEKTGLPLGESKPLPDGTCFIYLFIYLFIWG